MDKKTTEEYKCITCNYITTKKGDFKKHCLTIKHIKLNNKETNQNQNEYLCECGKFYKTRQGLYYHKNRCIHNGKNIVCEKIDLTDINMSSYFCNCGKSFKTRYTLNRHNINCPYENDNDNDNNSNNNDLTNVLTDVLEIQKDEFKNMISTVIKENKELRTIITDQSKQITEMIPRIGNNNNNTQNNNFNINVFLNEDCKNAINMSDFVKSICVSLEQLDFTKTNGLEKGLSKVIIENMSKLSLTERPLHCTDIKRETLYIKDNDVWEKDKDKSKIKQVIEKTSNKNYNAVSHWAKENPDFMDNENKQEFYAKAITTIGKPIKNIEGKIIKNLCKENYIKE
tara:strand:+ start:1584 stop:2606 length:1023 start_codon:yes stop_codon:yes gene_type:complete